MKQRYTSLGNGLLFGTSMRRRFSSLSSGLLFAAAFAGVACTDEEVNSDEATSLDEQQLGVSFEGLGAKFDTCTEANKLVGTDYLGTTTKKLTVTVAAGAGDAVLSVVGGKIRVNGYPCKAYPATTPGLGTLTELTSTNVTQIDIAVGGTSKVVIDLLPGTFGTLFSATGGVTISGAGPVTVGVRGTGGANVVRMAEVTGSSPLAQLVELTGDAKADLIILPTALGAVNFALGDGADSFTGQQLLPALTGGPTGSVVATSKIVTVYGGGGNDTLKGGTGDDTLNGGDGNDVFTTSAGDVVDGADTYIGGSGVDLMDYSGRTLKLDVSVAPTYAKGWIEGVNLHGFTAPTGVLTCTIGIAAVAADNYTRTFAGEVGTTAILGIFNTATTAAAASVNDRGELVLTNASPAGVDPVTGLAISKLVCKTSGAGAAFFGAIKNVPVIGQPTLAQSNDGAVVEKDADDGTVAQNNTAATPVAFLAEGDDVRADVENITGGSGNDILTGGIGSNTINGGAGDDNISGGGRNSDSTVACSTDVDVLNGGDGNDTFHMGNNPNCGDAIEGGLGKDTANYEQRTVALNLSLNGLADDGDDSLTDKEKDKIGAGIEVVLGGVTGAGVPGDIITGGAGDDELRGGPGNDTIVGGAGADTIAGGPGADSLLGGTGEDYFQEMDTRDTAFLGAVPFSGNVVATVSTTSTTGTAEGDVINGGTGVAGEIDTADYNRVFATTGFVVSLCNTPSLTGAPTTACAVSVGDMSPVGTTVPSGIIGVANNDTPDGDDLSNIEKFLGGAGNDTIYGSIGDDIIEGGAGNDSIWGGAGNDDLSGDAGNDRLEGDVGDDGLDGGTEDDTLIGGAGDGDMCTPGPGTNPPVASCET